MKTENNFIQWKATNLCMDFHCDCGTHNQYNGFFADFVECKGCVRVYKLDTKVMMEETNEDCYPLKDENELLMENGYDIKKIGGKTIYYAGLEDNLYELSIVEYYKSRFYIIMYYDSITIEGFWKKREVREKKWRPILLERNEEFLDLHLKRLYDLNRSMNHDDTKYSDYMYDECKEYYRTKEDCKTWIKGFDEYLKESVKYPKYH